MVWTIYILVRNFHNNETTPIWGVQLIQLIWELVKLFVVLKCLLASMSVVKYPCEHGQKGYKNSHAIVNATQMSAFILFFVFFWVMVEGSGSDVLVISKLWHFKGTL